MVALAQAVDEADATPALLLPFPKGGSGPAQSRSIPRGGVLLGRGRLLFDEPFDDPGMSARHAEIHLHGAHAVVEDLGSAFGTLVNGSAIRSSRPLLEGDVLRLADTMLVYTSMKRARAAGMERPTAELELTGATPSIEAVRRSVKAVATHPRTVLVTGETGTGKEIVARMLYRLSGRAGPFVAVNCGAFTEGLLASELFGHVRGAFTGAVTEQQGLFRAARGGSLLLDEVGELPLALQPTLLRVLENSQVRPVGSSRDVAVDVRVIAANNRELVTLVQQGRFRADLYARLAQWTIRLPALRDRREDIPALTRSLLAQLGAADHTLTADLEEALLVHPWPLNVRGLSNVLSTALIATPAGQPLGLVPEVRAALQENRIERSQPPPEAPPPVELDRARLEDLLRRFGGRVAETARHLGISRPKLYRLLWSAHLDPARFRGA